MRRVLPDGLLWVAAFTVLAFAPLASSASADATFVVDSKGDAPDASIGNGVCADATGSCTLRAAIAEANASVGSKDTITFDLPAPPFSIAPATELPLITDPVDIDGTTQDGFLDKPIVELRGDGLALGSRGVRLRTGDSLVRGLVINGFSRQITIETGASSGNRIVGNYLGTDLDGETGSGRDLGIYIASGDDHVIGGSAPGEGNVISGNPNGGIVIDGNPFATTDPGKITIRGNRIGTDASGQEAVLPQQARGISSEFPNTGTVVGGSGPADRNVISGNGTGVFLRGSSGHEVVGNLIGTNLDGTEAIPNGNGIAVELEATNSVIERNVVSGNHSFGMRLSAVQNVVVKGNMIGVDETGLEALSNEFEGIRLSSATGVQIGGTTEADRNIISGNRVFGVVIGDDSSNNRILGNLIGTDATGAAALPNGWGVLCCLSDGDNIVEGNVVAFNENGGVLISGHGANQGGQGTIGNAIRGNSIFANRGLGIDLGGPCTSCPDGVTANDAGDADTGPNGRQNFPVITSVTVEGGSTTIEGRLESRPDETYHVELFRNDECDESDFGEGETLLGAIDVPGDGSPFTVTYPVALEATEVVTSTATDAGNNTSEFSECLTTQVVSGATIVVAKETDPDGSPQTFSFSGAITITLADGQSQRKTVAPGIHTVSELVPAGWDATAIRCEDPSGDSTGPAVPVGPGGTATATFRVTAGETAVCTFTNTKRGSVTLKKTTNGVVDPTRDICFVLTGPSPAVDGVTRCTSGDEDGVLEWPDLVPGGYKICESPVPAGFTSFWKKAGVIVTPYNPDARMTPPEDLGNRCHDFAVSAGGAVAFDVDNSRPGGDPRTIGYWKNWNRCTSGNQSAAAAKNGGAAAGFFLVEDLLPQLIGDFSVTSCQQAVKLLSKQDQVGRSKASDTAYELGAQLLAARFNLAAGAETCAAVQQAVLDGQALLDQVNFSGAGDYLGSKVNDARRARALSLAGTLDRYNNGNLC